jgi:hypothetical protein
MYIKMARTYLGQRRRDEVATHKPDNNLFFLRRRLDLMFQPHNMDGKIFFLG